MADGGYYYDYYDYNQIDTYKIRDNWKYYAGKHWDFWVGPTSDDPERRRKLKREFQSSNIIGQCVDNWVNGLISQPFSWHIKDDSGDPVDPGAEPVKQLQAWLDWIPQAAAMRKREPFKSINPWKDFVLSLGVVSQAYLKLYTPEKFADNPDVIKRIHLISPDSKDFKPRYDDECFLESIEYELGRGKKEIHTIDGDYAVVNGDQRVYTGGRYLIQYAFGDSQITDSIKRQQNSINQALTMLASNFQIAGFRERTFLNAEMPDEELDRGAGVDQYHHATMDSLGNPLPINMIQSDPVPMDSFSAGLGIIVPMLYAEFNQLHLLSGNDGNVSEDSRVQQRAMFEIVLNGSRLPIEGAISNTLNTVLALLGYQGFTTTVELDITTGPRTASEKDALIKEYSAGALSQLSLIQKLGTVSDASAELEAIEQERVEQTAPIPSPITTSGDEVLGGVPTS